MTKPRKLYFCCNFDCTGMSGFPDDSRMFAATIACMTSDNLIEFFDKWRASGLKTANLMPSKKAARELCDAWNEAYRKNGVCAL